MNLPINLIARNISEHSSSIPGLCLIFSDMEMVERWVATKGNDEGFLENLRLSLYNLTEDELLKVCEKSDELLWVLFFIPTSSSFYLLDCLASVSAEIQSNLLVHATNVMNDKSLDEVRHAQVFLDRCKHLNTGNFLSTLVDEHFSQSLVTAIKCVKERSGNVY